jgi:hypothetical protein
MKMGDRPSHNLDGLDIDLARRIDAICRRFEADRRGRRQPWVKESLALVPVNSWARPDSTACPS